jgi:hypothetical protein
LKNIGHGHVENAPGMDALFGDAKQVFVFA